MKKILIITSIISLSALVSNAGEKYRYKCSCGATNTGAPYKTERSATTLPDTAREVNRAVVTVTKAFVCTNCQKQNCIVSRQSVGQRVVDVKVDENASQVWSSTHQPPPIKIK